MKSVFKKESMTVTGFLRQEQVICAGNRPEVELIVEMMPKSEYDTVHEFITYEVEEKTSATQHWYNLVSRQALPLGFARGAPIQRQAPREGWM
jgi:hypothetical protein